MNHYQKYIAIVILVLCRKIQQFCGQIKRKPILQTVRPPLSLIPNPAHCDWSLDVLAAEANPCTRSMIIAVILALVTSIEHATGQTGACSDVFRVLLIYSSHAFIIYC